MDRWEGRVALVTGASAGIGAAIAAALVKAGMKVVGVARRIDKLQVLEKELLNEKGSFLPLKCDLTKDEDIYHVFETIKKTFGGVDVCVNNAGMSCNNSLLEGTGDEWRTMMEINVIGQCMCTKLAVASMRERGVDDGHILNINSTSGHMVTPYETGQFHFYEATKHSVTAVTEGLRHELRHAKSRIRVSAISPGFVSTEFFVSMLNDTKAAQEFEKELPSLRPKDIADIAIYIISAPPHVEINDVIVRPTDELE